MSDQADGVAGGPIWNDPSDEQMFAIAGAARSAVSEVAQMIAGAADTAVAIPRSEWTVGETGAHLAFANIGWGLFARGLEYPYGDGTPSGLAEANEISLMSFPERDGPQLAKRMLEGARGFFAELEVRPADQLCPTPLGRMTLGTLTSYLMVHNLMHGCAVSAALNKQFPAGAGQLEPMWPFVRWCLEGPLVDRSAIKGISACVQVDVQGSFSFAFEIQNEQVRIVASPAMAVDCRMDAEPVHLFLVLIKMLTMAEAVALGKIAVYGDRPETGLNLMSFFHIP